MADYDSIEDPYCYPGTSVLKNRLGIRNADALSAFEADISDQRAREPLPAGRLSLSHFRAVHRHLFGDVYPWAGKWRTVRIGKERSVFCYPENIPASLRALFSDLRRLGYLRGRDEHGFAVGLAHFLAELNAIHAFREGNGRTQLAFARLIAEAAGRSLDFERLDPGAFLAAMIASFRGDETPLALQIRALIS